ncbi:MAG: CHAT domain-containing protein, partial [Acidobacteria bacterium]|nr:CHAT domain-containing protein [Acidobacteriota bacterium]
IFAAHQDELGLAFVKYNCANQYTCLNEFERALALYQESAQIYETLDMPLAINDVEYSIAWLYFQRGKFQESLRLFDTVRNRARELGDATLDALCDLDLSEVYLQLNAYEDATESAQSAIEKFSALQINYGRVKARIELRHQRRPDRVVHQLRQEAQQWERALERLMRRMRVEDAEYVSLQTVSRPDVAELRQCLAEDEVLVEYYTVKDQVKIFVVSSDGVRVVNDITTVGATAPLLRRLKFYFEKFTLSECYVNAHRDSVQTLTDQSLRLLYDQLVEPIVPLLEGKKILFVPHGVLHYVPFHALHDGRKYLIDRHEISYCPSASVFKLCSEKAQKKSANGPVCRQAGEVLIVGVPDEAAPLILDEAQAIQSLWPEARVLLGDEATLDRLKQQAPAYRLLHLASHGTFRRDNPMFSALKLSDAWLNFYDIFNLNLNADLVTLSACETGMNEVFPGDELFGLMRGFLYAGVPSLIVNLWMVHDRSTAVFMRWLYAGLREGLTKRAALRQAQLGVKQEYQHPYYWAPFIMMGAPV